MTKPSNPTPSFNRAALHLAMVDPGARFSRIASTATRTLWGLASRQAASAIPADASALINFGVHLSRRETLKVCFLEAVLRDSRCQAPFWAGEKLGAMK